MRFNPALMSVVCVAMLASACSSQPKQVAPAATSVPASAAQEGAAPAVNSALARKGYRVVKNGDKIAYCRSEVVTGTQFKRKVCLTEDQIRLQEQNAKEAAESMQAPRTSPACASPECVSRGGGG